ncbi:MAG: aminoacetone oxidase family FAD-binding enzyme [Bacteroidales bacterium]|nr:aminoacetone oxidase family FAD-binding enzyme [Bacteroidales bacterium]
MTNEFYCYIRIVKKIAVIGAGAAGCFAAANIMRMTGGRASVCVYEAGPRPLAKVAVTGGGRCNLTNSFATVDSLRDVYPRGFRAMQRARGKFSEADTFRWFEDAGVPLVTQDDGCVFPRSQDAMEIVRTLLCQMQGAQIKTGKKLTRLEEGFTLHFGDGSSETADIVLVAIGGVKQLPVFPEPISLTPLFPSLFTFRTDSAGLKSLMGIVTENSILSIPGTSFTSDGPLLITDWGLSGPAALKLSSYAAVFLAGKQYRSEVSVNWTGMNQEDTKSFLQGLPGARMLQSLPPAGINRRLWQHIIARAGVRSDIRCSEVGTKGLNRLSDAITRDVYKITGRAAWKSEFVTAGGVDLASIDTHTFRAKEIPGLYFAGEILDIDAVTGGFNLQAAWSTGYAAAEDIVKSLVLE